MIRGSRGGPFSEVPPAASVAADAAAAVSGHHLPKLWTPARATTCLSGMPSLAAKARRAWACAVETGEDDGEEEEVRPPLLLLLTEEEGPAAAAPPADPEVEAAAAAPLLASLAAFLGSNSLPSGAYAHESLLPGSKPSTGPPAHSTTTTAASWMTSAKDNFGAAASAMGLSHSTTSASPSFPGWESSCLVLLLGWVGVRERDGERES